MKIYHNTSHYSILENIIKTFDASDDIEILKQINYYIINNYEYDSSYENYTLLDTLLNKKMICAGYSALTKALLDRLGFENHIVHGRTSNDAISFLFTSGRHAWNLVKVGGFWYHLDITWNDSAGNEFAYFLKSDFYMKKNMHISWLPLNHKRYIAFFNKDIG